MAILLLGFALRMIHLDLLPLIGDEAYYRLWSRDLAFSYYDHPAGVALMLRASTMLAGDGEFGIRWLNAMLGFVTSVLAMAVGRRLLSRWAGVFAGAAIALGAPYLIVARFVYTDVLLLITVLLNLWAFDTLLEDDDCPQVAKGIFFGVTLILLLNTKYSAYLYVAALGGWILAERRTLLRRWAFWMGMGMGVLGLLPVVLWNAAHDWVSFRWQLSHFGMRSPGSQPLPLALQVLTNARHAWTYLTPPVFLAGIVGLGRLRRARERLLSWVALAMLIPVALSAANSPRNLTTGWVLLLMLAGTRLRIWRLAWPNRRSGLGFSRGLERQRSSTVGRRRLLITGLTLGLFLALGAFGVGTVAALSGWLTPLQSGAVRDIMRDAVGWRALGDAFADWNGAILTVDYSIAAQITYYAGSPAVTPWGQYLLWDWPLLDPVLVVSREYLPMACVTQVLSEAFRVVDGPGVWRVEDFGIARELHLWRAKRLRVEQAVLLQDLDFLNLQVVCR